LNLILLLKYNYVQLYTMYLYYTNRAKLQKLWTWSSQKLPNRFRWILDDEQLQVCGFNIPGTEINSVQPFLLYHVNKIREKMTVRHIGMYKYNFERGGIFEVWGSWSKKYKILPGSLDIESNKIGRFSSRNLSKIVYLLILVKINYLSAQNI